MSGVMFSFGRVLPGLLADGGRDDEVIGSTTDTSQPSASSSPYKAEVKCSASPCVCLRLSAPSDCLARIFIFLQWGYRGQLTSRWTILTCY